MACIQWADGVLTVSDSLFVWSHSLQRILESSSNCLTWYLPSWHVSKDRVPPHLWTFWMVFFLQSVQEVLSDAIVQPAGPTSGSRKTTQDQDPIYPNVIIWPYYELQAILEYDICMRIQVYQPLFSVLPVVATTTRPCRASMTKRSMIFPNCTCKHVQSSAFSVCCTVEVPHGCYQQSTITMLPNRCSLSHFCQQPFSGQTLHKWKLGKDNHQTPGCFFCSCHIRKMDKINGFEHLLLYKSTIYIWFHIKVLVLVPHDMCFSPCLPHHPTKSHVRCHIWSLPA